MNATEDGGRTIRTFEDTSSQMWFGLALQRLRDEAKADPDKARREAREVIERVREVVESTKAL